MPIKMELDWSKVVKALQILKDEFRPYMEVAWEQLAESGLSEVKTLTPNEHIRSFWHMVKKSTDTRTSFIINNLYPNKDVLIFFEVGTRPHTIKPVRAQALHFFWENAEIFSKNVFHPGTPAYRMVEQTMSDLQARLDVYMQETIRMAEKMLAERGK